MRVKENMYNKIQKLADKFLKIADDFSEDEIEQDGFIVNTSHKDKFLIK